MACLTLTRTRKGARLGYTRRMRDIEKPKPNRPGRNYDHDRHSGPEEQTVNLEVMRQGCYLIGGAKNMKKEEFLKVQYEALRQEILATQRRNFQTLGFGALSIPAASFLAKVHDIPALALAVPPLVLGIALLYLADNHGIIRCGEYIKEHIEKNLTEEGIMGWETWLEAGQEQGTRNTEHYTTYCFYLLFLLYFAAAVYMAWIYMKKELIFEVAVGATIVYCIFGVVVGFHIVKSLRLGTKRYDKIALESAPEGLGRRKRGAT